MERLTYEQHRTISEQITQDRLLRYRRALLAACGGDRKRAKELYQQQESHFDPIQFVRGN